jgi:hypothetical protein
MAAFKYGLVLDLVGFLGNGTPQAAGCSIREETSGRTGMAGGKNTLLPAWARGGLRRRGTVVGYEC